MANWMAPRNGNGSDFRRLPLELKRCPLCGTINACGSTECVTCSWSGSFDRDPEVVEEGLYEMMIRCPELADALMDVPARPVRRRVSFFTWLRGLFRRRLDFSA
jgi:hypothetical protein